MSVEKNSTEQKEPSTAAERVGSELTGQRQIISRKDAKALELKRYFTGKPCKHDHVSERQVSDGQCIECKLNRTNSWRKNNQEHVKLYSAQYKEANKEKTKQRMVDKYRENPEHYRELARERRRKDPERARRLEREWYARNITEIRKKKTSYRRKNPEMYRDSVNNWRKENPANADIRNILLRVISKWNNGTSGAESILGYTKEKLIQRIEFNFKGGMSWSNRSEWHIDHKKPVSAFIKQGITDPKIINALSNLQPLWAKDNLRKGTNYAR